MHRIYVVLYDHGYLVFIDLTLFSKFASVNTEMHQLLKMDLSTGKISTMELSNLGLLGFPAQCSSPVNFPISSRFFYSSPK